MVVSVVIYTYFCTLPKAIFYGNCHMKIQHNIPLFFKGVFVLTYGTTKEIVSLLFLLRKGEGEKGVFIITCETRKEIVSLLFWSRKGEGEKGVFVMNRETK